ncbi:MAG: hypothetical protein M3275_03015 [Thermoproteota archaeon]|nr:hypothetical protein [Thermoproteota archaeon]
MYSKTGFLVLSNTRLAVFPKIRTGSIVIDTKLAGKLTLPFIAFAPFVGVAIGVYLFGKYLWHISIQPLFFSGQGVRFSIQ